MTFGQNLEGEGVGHVHIWYKAMKDRGENLRPYNCGHLARKELEGGGEAEESREAIILPIY